MREAAIGARACACSSPLVVGDLVIVAAAGKLVAYDCATDEPRWFGPAASETTARPIW